MISTLLQTKKDATMRAFQVLTNRYGVDFKAYRGDPTATPYGVYGANPNEEDYQLLDTFQGVLSAGYGFVPYSPEEASEIEGEIYLYTTADLRPGDIVEITRSDLADTVKKRYRVTLEEAISFTIDVVKRFLLNPLID